MPSKTPNFDKALDEILNNLKPHQRTCRQCGGVFNIFQEDINFYKRLRVPPPTLCFNCRKQRRFGFYNDILKFYKKDCSAHPEEKVISAFAPESPYKISDLDYWWSDGWGGENYAKSYDLSKPFFEQFKDLNLAVPHQAILHYQTGVSGSPYTVDVLWAKNCYLTGAAGKMENVHYSYWVMFAKDCLDLLNVSGVENCYETINSQRCHSCFFCQNCQECISSYFLYNCRHCQNCFGCTNLRHKSYCFFNEQLSKDEYQQKVKQINLGNRDVLQHYQEKFKRFLGGAIRRSVLNDRKNINCLGDWLFGAKNCFQVFRAEAGLTIPGPENVRYSTDLIGTKDCLDLWMAGPNIFLSYEGVGILFSHRIKFSYAIRDSLDLEYCLECFHCQDCLGCIGLHHKKYHIFNQPYSEEEYFKRLDAIKWKMLKDGEYGEFFPLSMSLHPYNDTYAMIEFPLTREEVLKRGWQWYDEPKTSPDLRGLELIQAKDVPQDIREVSDDILNRAIVCKITGRPFRIIRPELEFYQRNNLPIPTKHPYQRILERFQKRNPAKLWKSVCGKCHNDIYTSYPPEEQKALKIYCESCYLKEVV